MLQALDVAHLIPLCTLGTPMHAFAVSLKRVSSIHEGSQSVNAAPKKRMSKRSGELRLDGVLGSSLPASNSQATAKITHLSDTLSPPWGV